LIKIAHRGCFNGTYTGQNTLNQIKKAIDNKYFVEIDVYYTNRFLIGHDLDKAVDLDMSFVFDNKNLIYIHAKSSLALSMCLNYGLICFANDCDKFSLTSNGYIWTYKNHDITNRTIVCKPEELNVNYTGAYGICSNRLI